MHSIAYFTLIIDSWEQEISEEVCTEAAGTIIRTVTIFAGNGVI